MSTPITKGPEMDRMFDPTPYSDRTKKPRDERAPRRKVEQEPITRVALGQVWRLTTKGGKAEVHAFEGMRVDWMLTKCGAMRIPLTFEPGTIAAGCPRCLAAGVRRDVL